MGVGVGAEISSSGEGCITIPFGLKVSASVGLSFEAKKWFTILKIDHSQDVNIDVGSTWIPEKTDIL